MTFKGQPDTGKVSSRPCESNDVGLVSVAFLGEPQSAVQYFVSDLRSAHDL